MKRPIEYSNSNGAGRVIETPEGKGLVKDIRMLGCPDELAKRIEQRNAASNGLVAQSEVDAMRQRLALQAQIPVTL